jgi:uncharacterized protein (TIGR02453 family)
MAILQPDYFDYFKDLAKNNNTVWFNENKKRYEKSAKEPFLALIEAVVAALNDTEPDLGLVPTKQMLFRINRDIRFSKDKRPYKENLAASIGRFGTKDKIYPGHYLQMGVSECFLAGGAYWFEEKEMLNRVRHFIADNPERFQNLLNEKAFSEKWTTIQGEKNKRLPNADLTEAAAEQPLIYNTQFYWSATFDSQLALQDNFVDILRGYFEAAQNMNQFLIEAMYG